MPLTYGALCALAEKHNVTITENMRAFVRAVEEEDLRAQADARPAGHFFKASRVHQWVQVEKECQNAVPLYTHPEASAPGLSVEDAMRIVMANWGDKAAIEKAFAANLTRVSPATAPVEDELSTKDFQSPSELERCPFCGGKACMKEVLDGDRAVGYRAHCANFWCTGWQPCLTSQTPEVAASVWNKRHSAATVAEPSDNWRQYAKDGETAQQCIERHRAEHDALLTLLAKAKSNECPLGCEEGICGYEKNGQASACPKESIRWKRERAAQQQAEPHPSQAHPTFQTVSLPNGPGTPSAQTFDRRIACKAGKPEWKSCAQQAEPGADEAVTHRMNVARTVYAIQAQKQEPQPERRDWFDAGFKAGFADRASQSGQSSEPGADERALKQAVERLILECKTVDYVLTNRKNPDDARRCFAEAADRVTKLIAAQSGQREGVADVLREVETVCRSKIVKTGDDFALGAHHLAIRILAMLAAAPTQQKEGGK